MTEIVGSKRNGGYEFEAFYIGSPHADSILTYLRGDKM